MAHTFSIQQWSVSPEYVIMPSNIKLTFYIVNNLTTSITFDVSAFLVSPTGEAFEAGLIPSLTLKGKELKTISLGGDYTNLMPGTYNVILRFLKPGIFDIIDEHTISSMFVVTRAADVYDLAVTPTEAEMPSPVEIKATIKNTTISVRYYDFDAFLISPAGVAIAVAQKLNITMSAGQTLRPAFTKSFTDLMPGLYGIKVRALEAGIYNVLDEETVSGAFTVTFMPPIPEIIHLTDLQIKWLQYWWKIGRFPPENINAIYEYDMRDQLTKGYIDDMLGAGIGDELLGKTELPPEIDDVPWFINLLNTSFDMALAAFLPLTNAVKDAILYGLLQTTALKNLLENFARYLGNKFADDYPEYAILKNIPEASLTVLAVLGLIAGCLGSGFVYGWLRKELPEPAGMAVWAAIEAQEWTTANDANSKYINFINAMDTKLIKTLTWLNPFTAGYFNTMRDSQLAQAATFQTLIDENLVVKAQIIINSTPSGAKIYIDDVYMYAETNTTLTVEPGHHKLTLKLETYNDKSFEFDIAEGQSTTFSVTLVKTETQGTITVSSFPSGAKIYIDDVDTFNKTNTALLVTAGHRKLTLKLAGYLDKTEEFDIAIGQSKTFSYTLEIVPIVKGRLHLAVSPSDAMISVAGHPEINAPGTYELLPGSYTINASADGYYPSSVTSYIEQNEDEYVSISLTEKPPTPPPEPEKATLLITSQPAGAKIYINGVYKYVVTPYTILLAPNPYIIRLELDDYKISEETVTLSEGETRTYLKILEPITAPPTPPPEVPVEEVVIPLEPVTPVVYNAWKVTVKAVDAATNEPLSAGILINDEWMDAFTPWWFYFAPESSYNIKLRKTGYKQGEVVYTTPALPEA